MKIRIYKQVIELGHYIPNFEAYWDDWVVDCVIEDAEDVKKYLTEAKKESTSFGGGVYYSKTLGKFSIKYYPLREEEVE